MSEEGLQKERHDVMTNKSRGMSYGHVRGSPEEITCFWPWVACTLFTECTLVHAKHIQSIENNIVTNHSVHLGSAGGHSG